jgi:hypothetical protein
LFHPLLRNVCQYRVSALISTCVFVDAKLAFSEPLSNNGLFRLPKLFRLSAVMSQYLRHIRSIFILILLFHLLLHLRRWFRLNILMTFSCPWSLLPGPVVLFLIIYYYYYYISARTECEGSVTCAACTHLDRRKIETPFFIVHGIAESRGVTGDPREASVVPVGINPWFEGQKRILGLTLRLDAL